VTDTTAQAGLRERKKARTRASLREHALRLFREQGYQATTVEQIAAAAELSPSTFFRYFPTKEDVVLQDDMDTRIVEAFARQPRDLSPVAAFRAAMRESWASFTPDEWVQFREGAKLARDVPEVRVRSLNEYARLINVIGRAIADREGRPADDLRVRVLAGAIIGSMMAVFMPEHLDEGASPDPDSVGPESLVLVDEALALLEEGLPL
jgi:AcrR family transcriptional regulator